MKKQNQLLENWKDIVNYESLYQVSNYGRIKSLDKWKNHPHSGMSFFKERIIYRAKNNKYQKIYLWKNNSKKSFTIHQLVAIHFIENPFNLLEINHKNGIKSDNRIQNLEWSTRSDNVQHAFDNGLAKKGESHYNSKMTEQKILAIRRLYKINPKFNKRKLSRKLKISHTSLLNILKNKTWKINQEKI